MIRGRGHAVFFVEQTSGGYSETLTIRVNNRIPLTHRNAVGKTEKNKATREVKRTIKGYRFEEELTIVLPAHYSDLQAWIDRNNDTTKESDFHKMIRVLDYSNRPDYRVLFWPREEMKGMIEGIECRVREKEISQSEGIRSDSIVVVVRGVRTLNFPVIIFKDIYKLLYDFNSVQTSTLIFDYENVSTSKDVFDYSSVLTSKLLSAWTLYERIERMQGLIVDLKRVEGFGNTVSQIERTFGFGGIIADDLQRVSTFANIDEDQKRIFGFVGVEEQLARIAGFDDIDADLARVHSFESIQSEI